MTSAERAELRRATAYRFAVEQYQTTDLEIGEESRIEYVDGGYWVPARIFVDWQEVELTAFPDATDITNAAIRADLADANIDVG